MLEGWHEDEYVILFEGEEGLAIAGACELAQSRPQGQPDAEGADRDSNDEPKLCHVRRFLPQRDIPV
jgi:hypothetical protein